MSTFTPFPLLPPELRLEIWRLAIPSHRRIVVNKRTTLKQPLLDVCQESRDVIQKHLIPMIDLAHPHRPFLVDLETDSFEPGYARHVSPYLGAGKAIAPLASAALQPKRIFRIVTLPRAFFSLRAFYHRILLDGPLLRDIVIVLQRVEDITVLASDREKFLRFVKREVVDGLWDRLEFLQGVQWRCQEHFGKGYVWRVPRVFFDVEALVEGGGEVAREVDMEGVKGRCDEVLGEKWKACMFVRERGELFPRTCFSSFFVAN